jgi:hypothetical protein
LRRLAALAAAALATRQAAASRRSAARRDARARVRTTQRCAPCARVCALQRFARDLPPPLSRAQLFSEAAVGIDLGTTFSVVAVCQAKQVSVVQARGTRAHARARTRDNAPTTAVRNGARARARALRSRHA